MTTSVLPPSDDHDAPLVYVVTSCATIPRSLDQSTSVDPSGLKQIDHMQDQTNKGCLKTDMILPVCGGHGYGLVMAVG